MKKILIVTLSLIAILISSPAVANCDNMSVVATVVDSIDSFAVINANPESEWKDVIRVGDRYKGGVVEAIRVEEVWISYGENWCVIHRAEATDSYLDWSSSFVVKFEELLFNYQSREFLLNLIEDDLATLGLDGGRDSNPELWSDLNNEKTYIEMLGLHYDYSKYRQ